MFDIHTTVHFSTKSAGNSPEAQAKHAIEMVFADCANNRVIVCVGASLQVCDPPEDRLRLLAGCQHESGFRDGISGEARLSVIYGVAVDKRKIILFTDCMNNCIRQIGEDGRVCTLYGALPVWPHVHSVPGFVDGHSTTARFNRPWGLCLHDEEQTILAVDGCNSSIRSIKRDTTYVSTLSLTQDMSREIATGELPMPTQMLYPSGIQVSKHGVVYVVGSSSHAIFKIDFETMQFRSIPFYCAVSQCNRPTSMDLTPSGRLLVGYAGYDEQNSQKNTKMVYMQDTELWRALGTRLYYKHSSTGLALLLRCACRFHWPSMRAHMRQAYGSAIVSENLVFCGCASASVGVFGAFCCSEY